MPKQNYLSYDSCNFNIIETGEGFLKAKVTVTYPDVLDYWSPSGVIKKAKLPEDVLSESTIDSLRGIPVTIEHPIDGGEPVLVTPDNATRFSRGSLSEPKIENGKIVGLMTVYDRDAIEKIKAGTVGVSIGYTRNEIFKAGEYNGKKYDCYHEKIMGNHLAITSQPRAEMAGINFDSQYIDKIYKKETTMSKYVIQDKDGQIIEGKLLTFKNKDGQDVSIDSKIMDEIDAVKSASNDEIKKLKSDIDSKTAEIETLKKSNESDEIKKLQADIDSKQNEILGLKKQIDDKKAEFDSAINSAIESRVKLHSQARALGFETDAKSDTDIKNEVIAKYMPEVKTTEADIDAYYSAALAIVDAEKKKSETGASVDAKSIEEMRAAYTADSQKIIKE